MGVSEFTFLANGLGLRLLRLCKLRLALVIAALQIFKRLRLMIKIDREGSPRFFGLFLGDLLAFGLQPLRNLRLQGLLGFLDRVLLRPNRRLALGDLGLLRSQLLIALAPDSFDERSGQSLRQLDLGPAVWANDRRLQAQSLR